MKIRIVYDLNSSKDKQMIEQYISRNRKKITGQVFRDKFSNVEIIKFFIGDEIEGIEKES